jgi:hypothetical protein
MKQGITYAIAITIFIGATMLFSCNKETISEDTTKNFYHGHSETKLVEKINCFKKKIGTKSTDLYTPDDAKWFVEAALNYTYAEAQHDIEKIINHETTITIKHNEDGLIEHDEVSKLYDRSLESLRDSYNKVNGLDKNLVTVDISIIENNKNSNDNTLTFNLRATINSRGLSTPTTFGSNDYWAWGLSEGYCDGPYDSIYSNSDAAQELQKKIHIRKSEPGGRYWYSDEEMVVANSWDFINHNDSVQGDHYRDYLMFFSNYNWNNPETCINPNQMYYYLTGTEYVIYTYDSVSNPGARPAGKDFISIDIESKHFISNDNIAHIGKINYGVLHTSNDPIEKL